MKIAVFASGNGTDLQAIIDGCKIGMINAEVALVISNNEDAFALERARNENIPEYCLNNKQYTKEELIDKILEILEAHNIDIIFLAGYLKMIDQRIINEYPDSIFNIHPALLSVLGPNGKPKYGGKGMYGINIHKAIIENNELTTGITIHKVSPDYDEGDILAETSLSVYEDDTPESLQARVLEREHEFLVEVLSEIVNKKLEKKGPKKRK